MNVYNLALIIGAAALVTEASRKPKDPMMLSKNFSLKEFFKKGDYEKGIPPEVLMAIKDLVDNVLQPARDKLGMPIRVNSAYRSPEFNASIGGAANSQHIYGQAVDIAPIPATLENYKKLWSVLKTGPFDQLIWENALAFTGLPSHIHVSYVEMPGAGGFTYNRSQVMQLYNGVYSYI